MKVKRKKISRIDVVRELSGYSRATVYMAYQGHSDNAKVLGIIDIIDEEPIVTGKQIGRAHV